MGISIYFVVICKSFFDSIKFAPLTTWESGCKPTVELDFDSLNESLRDASAEEIVAWALGLGRKTIATTSMGRNAAVMLHLVSQVDKIPAHRLGRHRDTTCAIPMWWRSG